MQTAFLPADDKKQEPKPVKEETSDDISMSSEELAALEAAFKPYMMVKSADKTENVQPAPAAEDKPVKEKKSAKEKKPATEKPAETQPKQEDKKQEEKPVKMQGYRKSQ